MAGYLFVAFPTLDGGYVDSDTRVGFDSPRYDCHVTI